MYLGEKIAKVRACALAAEKKGSNQEAAGLWQETSELMRIFALDTFTLEARQRRLLKAAGFEARALELRRNKTIQKASVKKKTPPHSLRLPPNEIADEAEQRMAGLRHKSRVTWDQIGGVSDVREALEWYFAIFLARKPKGVQLDSFRNVLFYGPPGTGKTMIAAAVSNQLDAAFFNVKASDLVSKWFGESSRLISSLYKEARSAADTGLSLIFIDEIDAFCRARDAGTSGAEQRILSTLLAELDGLAEKGDDKGVLTIAATNRPDSLDDAVKSRFQKQFHIPLPDQAGRRDILQRILKVKGLEADFSIDQIARKIKGFSGRNIEGLVRGAAARMIARNNKALSGYVRQPVQERKPYTLVVSALDTNDFTKEIEAMAKSGTSFDKDDRGAGNP